MSTLVRLAAFASLLLSLACQDSAQPRQTSRGATDNPEPTTIVQAHYSGFTQSARQVIANQTDWAAAWAQLYLPYQPKPDLPAVDFGSERVILAALGNRNSGGYSIQIDAIASSGAGTTVVITSVAPGSGCGVTLALTQPVHVVRVPTPAGSVTFEERSVTHDCGA